MLGITGDPDFAEPFRPLFVDMPKVPVPWTYRIPENVTPEKYAIECANALEECIRREGPETVLAFVIEPVGGTATGALVAPDIYHTMVRKTCSKYGVYLVFDEVMSGAGRTGKFLAAHHWPDCRPDIVALAKGVSGGYAPLGAVLTSSDLVHDLRRMGGFIHGHTYAANPQACAVACAVLDEVVDRNLIANATSSGEILAGRLRELAVECDVIGDVRGRGLLLAIEIVADKFSRRMFPAEWDAIGRIRDHCRENGLVLLSRRTSGGRFGEWLMVCPPLIIEEPQIDELIAALRRALVTYQKEISGRRT
jgi:adenosylmethionine-8-amino-7-oxononanoate aminotransferase